MIAARAVPPPATRRPTRWTRPLQLCTAVLFGAEALFAASLPFWFISTMTQYANAMNQAHGVNPTPPPGMQASLDSMNAVATAMLYATSVVVFVFCAIAVIASIRLWTWAYYAILAVLIVQVLEAIGGLFNATLPSLLMPGTPPPVAVVGPELIVLVASVGLIVWMAVALVRHGPWAMSAVS